MKDLEEGGRVLPPRWVSEQKDRMGQGHSSFLMDRSQGDMTVGVREEFIGLVAF